MKKYLLSVLFFCLIMVSSRTAWAERVCSGTNSGDYTLNSSGVLTLNSACTSIAENAFKDDTGIVSVDLSNTSVTSILDHAFENCAFLTSVKFPDSLTYIEGNAFLDCSSLTSVDLSNTSITKIRGSAFENCTSLASINLSNTPPFTMGNRVFLNIKNPATITVTKGSQAHQLLGGSKGTSAVTGDAIDYHYGESTTTLFLVDPPTPTPTPDPSKPTPTPDPLDPTPLPTATPEPGTASGSAEVIRVVPLPEDEFGSYEVDPVTGEKNYLMFNTYDICMDFLNDDALCSGYERCYHK